MLTEEGVAARNILHTAVRFAKPEYRDLLKSIEEYYHNHGVLSEKQCKIVTNTLHFQVLHPVKVANV